MGKKDIIDVLLGVIIPPVEVFRMKGIGIEFVICLVLWICTITVGGILYCFHLKGVDILANILCIFLPPVGVYCGQGGCKKDAWVTLVLTFFFWVPGVLYAYWIV